MTGPKEPRTLGLNGALWLEFGVIGLGIIALVMIFQPLSLPVFSVGCGLVVVAALANNLIPMAEPGTQTRSVVTAAFVIALIFTSALLVAIVAAYFYGVIFLDPPDTSTSLRPPRPPFWEHPFIWGLVTVELALIGAVTVRSRNKT